MRREGLLEGRDQPWLRVGRLGAVLCQGDQRPVGLWVDLPGALLGDLLVGLEADRRVARQVVLWVGLRVDPQVDRQDLSDCQAVLQAVRPAGLEGDPQVARQEGL